MKNIRKIAALSAAAVLAALTFGGCRDNNSPAQTEKAAVTTAAIDIAEWSTQNPFAAETTEKNTQNSKTTSAKNKTTTTTAKSNKGKKTTTSKAKNNNSKKTTTTSAAAEEVTTTSAFDSEDGTYAEYHFRSKKLLTEHFEKHGAEFKDDFDYKTAQEYEKGASDVVNNSEALHKTEAEDGDGVYYIEATNEFVILSKDGYIRTYFRPNGGKSYYDRQ